MKKVLIIIILLTNLNLIKASQTGVNLDACPRGCSWQNIEECKSGAQEGFYIMPDDRCQKMAWLGNKGENQVCCCNCTGESAIASEIT